MIEVFTAFIYYFSEIIEEIIALFFAGVLTYCLLYLIIK